MNFAVTLSEPYNNTHFHIFKEKGYEVSLTSDILPNFVVVSKANGNVEELLDMEIVDLARMLSGLEHLMFK